jgi:hypothetical protein
MNCLRLWVLLERPSGGLKAERTLTPALSWEARHRDAKVWECALGVGQAEGRAGSQG